MCPQMKKTSRRVRFGEKTPELGFGHVEFEMPIGDSSGDVRRQLERPKFCKGYPDAQDPELALEELTVQL